MISALTFVYNEGDKLGVCLESIRQYVGEIIVYDLESTDNTFEVAKEFTQLVYKVPHLLCGDSYKIELAHRAKGNWLFWVFADEYFPKETMETFAKLTVQNTFDAFAFMRREYMDGIRVGYGKDGRVIYFGSPAHPNYQMRLIRVLSEIFYTELVHAECHGKYRLCNMPPEYFMEHRKTSKDQEFDNVRLYIWYKYLIWKYGDTILEPYKTFIDSYKRIIGDATRQMAAGERRVHPAEENWWDWRNYTLVDNQKEIVDKVVTETKELTDAKGKA